MSRQQRERKGGGGEEKDKEKYELQLLFQVQCIISSYWSCVNECAGAYLSGGEVDSFSCGRKGKDNNKGTLNTVTNRGPHSFLQALGKEVIWTPYLEKKQTKGYMYFYQPSFD